eukprot:scaffold47862_cov28-Tisochrysis_lutea.AAC.3
MVRYSGNRTLYRRWRRWADEANRPARGRAAVSERLFEHVLAHSGALLIAHCRACGWGGAGLHLGEHWEDGNHPNDH